MYKLNFSLLASALVLSLFISTPKALADELVSPALTDSIHKQSTSDYPITHHHASNNIGAHQQVKHSLSDVVQ